MAGSDHPAGVALRLQQVTVNQRIDSNGWYFRGSFQMDPGQVHRGALTDSAATSPGATIRVEPSGKLACTLLPANS